MRVPGTAPSHNGPNPSSSGRLLECRCPKGLSNAGVPLRASIRSCRPLRPLPVVARALPTPSSSIVNMGRPSNDVGHNTRFSAFAYLAAFVGVSATTK